MSKLRASPSLISRLVIEPQTSTLTKFIFDEETKHVHATGELTELLSTFQVIAKMVSAMINRIGLSQVYGVGEKQKDPKKFQNLVNDIFINILSSSNSVGIIIPSEAKKATEVKGSKGKYIVAFNPVNGLSNLDTAITMGSIFLVTKKYDDSLPGIEDALNPDNKIVSAGYVVYGSATVFVFTTGETVDEFVLDPQIGEFLLAERAIKIPKRGNFFSINAGNYNLWDENIKWYVREKSCFDRKKKYHGRYVGSMVADVHRILKHGGIYLYPSNDVQVNGKLNLFHDCKPMAYIISVAGGLASDGLRPILGIQTTEIQQKSPLFIGSKDEVEDLIKLINKGNKSDQ